MTIPDITRLYKISQLQNYLFNPSLLRRHEVKSMAAVRSRTRVLCEKRRVCVCVCVGVFRRVLVCEGQRLLHVWCRSRSVEEVRNKRKLEVYNPTRSLPSIPSAGGGGSHRCEQISSISLPTTVCDLLKSTKKKIL